MTDTTIQTPFTTKNSILRAGLALGALATLAACADPAPQVNERGYLTEVPENVLALAAPYQNLNSVRLRPEDNCYWYRYQGPVESTELPLRTRDGRPICVQPAA